MKYFILLILSMFLFISCKEAPDTANDVYTTRAQWTEHLEVYGGRIFRTRFRDRGDVNNSRYHIPGLAPRID